MAEKKEEMMEEVLEDLEKDAAEKQAEEVSEAEETETETEAAESGEQAEETEESEAEDGQEAPADEKKGFFKKKKDKKDEQIEELNDKLKRQMAEFDNFRKRTEKEKTQMYDMGAKSIIEKILPVIDNFERGLAAVPEEQREDAFVVGMDKVYRQMLTELDASGVKPIEAVGQEFDPNFHNAVMQVEARSTIPEWSHRSYRRVICIRILLCATAWLQWYHSSRFISQTCRHRKMSALI